MYRCSTACCENTQYGMEDVQNCIDNCAKPLQIGQKVLGQELQTFQVLNIILFNLFYMAIWFNELTPKWTSLCMYLELISTSIPAG